MDRLEEFIKSHRAEFDDRQPDAGVWQRIAAQLPEQRPAHRQVYLWKLVATAAVMLVLILCGVVAGMYMSQGRMSQNGAYAEFFQAQQYYQSQYDRKKTELAHFAYDPEIDADLRELDNIYEDLLKELTQSNPRNRDELIYALIQNYKTRIQLLERILDMKEQNAPNIQTPTQDENLKI